MPFKEPMQQGAGDTDSGKVRFIYFMSWSVWLIAFKTGLLLYSLHETRRDAIIRYIRHIRTDREQGANN